MLLLVAQQAQVVARAEGRAQLHLDAVAPQLGLIALAEGRIRTLLGAGGEHDAPRRRGVEQQIGGREQPQADEQERAPRQDQVPHRDQRLADDARHYAATFSVIGALGSQLSPGSRVNVNSSEYSAPFFRKFPIRALVTPNWLSVARCGSLGS